MLYIWNLLGHGDQVIYSFTSAGPVLVALANTMVMFNAAVNPFAYVLLNQLFRKEDEENDMLHRLLCT